MRVKGLHVTLKVGLIWKSLFEVLLKPLHEIKSRVCGNSARTKLKDHVFVALPSHAQVLTDLIHIVHEAAHRKIDFLRAELMSKLY